MIVIHNNLIPLGKARTINFFGVLFTKNKNLTPKTENLKCQLNCIKFVNFHNLP